MLHTKRRKAKIDVRNLDIQLAVLAWGGGGGGGVGTNEDH